MTFDGFGIFAVRYIRNVAAVLSFRNVAAVVVLSLWKLSVGEGSPWGEVLRGEEVVREGGGCP